MKKLTSEKSFFQSVLHDRLLTAFICILLAKLFFFGQITSESLKISSFLASGLAIIFLLNLSLFFKRQWLKFSYLMSLNVMVSLLLLIHSLHFKYFLDFATVYELRYVHLLFGPGADSVLALIGKEILLILDLPFLPFLALRLNKTAVLTPFKRTNAAMFLFFWGVLVISYPVFLDRLLPSDYFKNGYSRESVVSSFGIFNYQALDSYFFLTTARVKAKASQQDVGLVSKWFKKRHEHKQPSNALTGIGKGMNVIFLQMESMQGFVIGMSLQGNEVTPNLNRLMDKSISFTRIYDQTGLGSSSDATFLANCSLFPSRQGAISFRYYQDDFDSLPKMLRQQDYSTATMHGNHRGYWNSYQFEKSIGFEQQFYADAYEIDETIGWGLSDRSFFSQSAEKIMALHRPFYAFLRSLTSHPPFDYVTAEHDSLPLGKFEGSHMGNYLRSMHYVDATFGEFMEQLSTQGVLSNTVVVVYGDHRASFSDDEFASVGVDPDQERRRIPLIISVPTSHQKEKRDVIGGLVDVTPTVLNILGIDSSDKYFMGRDLNSPADDDYVILQNGAAIGEPQSPASEQLMISDLIVEKDLIPRLRKARKERQ